MNIQIVISGLGGQGVLLISSLLAHAAMNSGEHVLTSETHGMAQRGGTVISHLKIGNFSSPLVKPGRADVLIALTHENFEQHWGFLKQDGHAIVNSSIPLKKKQFETLIRIDADDLAFKDNNLKSVNLYMLGAAVEQLQVCTLEQLKEQINDKFQGKKSQLRELALKALMGGSNAVKAPL